MKNVINKYLSLVAILFLLGSFSAWGQSSKRLKQKQADLIKKIQTTKSLLSSTSQSTQISLNKVQLIEKQVSYQESLLRNLNNQIRTSELKIKQKEGEIQELNSEITKLKKQYKELLLYAYKKRSKYGKLMYIFSAKTVEEALKRKLYLQKLADIQKKQLYLIEQNKIILKKKIALLNKEKKHQEELANTKESQREELLAAKTKKVAIYKKFKKKKKELKEKLVEQQKVRARLKQEIAEAIKREIAAERARRERERKRREALARKKSAAAKKKAAEEKEHHFEMVKADKLIGNNFRSNKGHLPWPVKKGTITLDYGKHRNPNLPNVMMQNNGVDISTPLNANVLSVYKGVVTTVIDIPGAGKVVIIKHGNFRTVYANLQKVYVTKGKEVKTGTPIGSLLPNGSGDISVVHFEIHEVTGGSVEQLNPDLWISQQ